MANLLQKPFAAWYINAIRQ